MRIYDPRLGKFLSVDPITRKFPELTPYQFASNRPIEGIDLDGEEFKSTITEIAIFKHSNGSTSVKVTNSTQLQIQIINLSSETLGFSGAYELVPHAHNLAFQLNGINSAELLSAHTYDFQNKKPINTTNYMQNVTYVSDVTANVSVVKSIDELSDDAFVIAIVDKVPQVTDGEIKGLANPGKGFALLDVNYTKSGQINLKNGGGLLLHEMGHNMGLVTRETKQM